MNTARKDLFQIIAATGIVATVLIAAFTLAPPSRDNYPKTEVVTEGGKETLHLSPNEVFNVTHSEAPCKIVKKDKDIEGHDIIIYDTGHGGLAYVHDPKCPKEINQAGEDKALEEYNRIGDEIVKEERQKAKAFTKQINDATEELEDTRREITRKKH